MCLNEGYKIGGAWGIALLAAVLIGTSTVSAQDVPAEVAEKMAEMKEKVNGGKGKTGSIKPYDEVITEEAETKPGLFLVHELEGKLYYEIPTETFGLDMLWVTQLARTGAGKSYGGYPAGDKVVRWEQRDEKILLRLVEYTIRARDDDPRIREAIEANTVAPIIMSFPIKAYGKDKAPVIEVTSLFTSDVPEFSVKGQLNGASIDSSRTFLEQVKAFPKNIETEVLATYRLKQGGSGLPFFVSGGNQTAATVVVHHSMVKLPEEPMTPREHDERVGYFTVRFNDFADDPDNTVQQVRYITRWRLEKKDPEAEVSEPKKPIVFYVGPGVPTKWVPYVKKGIEAWQPAFEAAGFKNAILAKDAPDPRQDPDWDPEDARISTIRWLPSTVENAFGPHVHDPRTGEILEADVRMYHNVLKLARDWYFVQASPSDERAQKLPMPDDLVGDLLAFVVAHEVGHSLGFPHNMKASSTVTVEQLRDPEWTKKHGTAPSIMDYARFNYVAQPGDGAALLPQVSIYDYFAVEWGYREFSDAKGTEAVKEKLNKIVARQKDEPMLRFGDPNPAVDPTQQSEDLTSDPIAATELGLKNLDRVMGYLVEATTEPGDDYELLDNMYDAVLGQRNRELGHVANVIGGVVQQNLYYGDADARFFGVAKDRQKSAMAFLNANAFQVPNSLVAPDLLRRLEASGVANRILNSQRSVLRSLMSENRIIRMAEQVTFDSEAAYAPTEFMDDLTGGIWTELDDSSVTIDLYRRNLQRAYVETLTSAVKTESPRSDLPALARGQLRKILTKLQAKRGQAGDEITSLHIQQVIDTITQALDPRPSSEIIVTTTNSE